MVWSIATDFIYAKGRNTSCLISYCICVKKIEKDQAIALRQQGLSVNEIVHKLGVAKGSVSLWVRDIELTAEQRKGLSERGRSVESVERRRHARLANERKKRRVRFDAAEPSQQVQEG